MAIMNLIKLYGDLVSVNSFHVNDSKIVSSMGLHRRGLHRHIWLSALYVFLACFQRRLWINLDKWFTHMNCL